MYKPRELTLPSIPALALYAATLVVELPVLFVRMLAVTVLAALVLVVKGHSPAGADQYADLALIPTCWAALALFTPLGAGWWWRQRMGGRDPSERERTAYEDAVELLRTQARGPLRLPATWFVIDSPHPDAAVCGQALMLSRTLLESEFLPAVLAHELGHLDSSDGTLTSALNRLVLQPPARARAQEPAAEGQTVVVGADPLTLSVTMAGVLVWAARRVVAFARGGLGLRLLSPFWGAYWREREHAADEYAAALGQGDELADFLEIHALVHDRPVPFVWLSEHAHPPTELRIERLRRASIG